MLVGIMPNGVEDDLGVFHTACSSATLIEEALRKSGHLPQEGKRMTVSASYINPQLPDRVRGLYKADLRERSIQTVLNLAGDLIQELIDLRVKGADGSTEPVKNEADSLHEIEVELGEWVRGERSWCDQHHGKPDEIELTARADEATIRLLMARRDALQRVKEARQRLRDADADAARELFGAFWENQQKAGWVCSKCAREMLKGFDDGQVPEHHRTCEKRIQP